MIFLLTFSKNPVLPPLAENHRENGLNIPNESTLQYYRATKSFRSGTNLDADRGERVLGDILKGTGACLFLSSLSDLGARSEPSGRASPFFRSFEENSRSYLTKRIGKMGRYHTGAVGAAQVRQAARQTSVARHTHRLRYAQALSASVERS